MEEFSNRNVEWIPLRPIARPLAIIVALIAATGIILLALVLAVLGFRIPRKDAWGLVGVAVLYAALGGLVTVMSWLRQKHEPCRLGLTDEGLVVGWLDHEMLVRWEAVLPYERPVGWRYCLDLTVNTKNAPEGEKVRLFLRKANALKVFQHQGYPYWNISSDLRDSLGLKPQR